jgi:hypothetical protein
LAAAASARLLIAVTLVFGSGGAKEDWIDRTLVTVNALNLTIPQSVLARADEIIQ